MTVDILICTIDEGVLRVPEVLMEPCEGIGYVVSMQYTDESYLSMVPDVIRERKDVILSCVPGRGLSVNRNNALSLSEADIRVIADDDNRYERSFIDRIVSAYAVRPDADVVCFAAESYDGRLMKSYPSVPMTYGEAFSRGYYPTSMEMTMRRRVDVRFDSRFGLGSERLCAGEEDVFMKDVCDAGFNALFVPEVIVRSRFHTTGCDFLTNECLQVTKGATFRYIFGVREAIWRSVKEACYHLVYSHVNPFSIFCNMMKGIWMYR